MAFEVAFVRATDVTLEIVSLRRLIYDSRNCL